MAKIQVLYELQTAFQKFSIVVNYNYERNNDSIGVRFSKL